MTQESYAETMFPLLTSSSRLFDPAEKKEGNDFLSPASLNIFSAANRHLGCFLPLQTENIRVHFTLFLNLNASFRIGRVLTGCRWEKKPHQNKLKPKKGRCARLLPNYLILAACSSKSEMLGP